VSRKRNGRENRNPSQLDTSSGEPIPGRLLLSRACFSFGSTFAKFQIRNYIYKLSKKEAIYPFKIIREVTNWQKHHPEQVKTMKNALAKLKEQGINSLNDAK